MNKVITQQTKSVALKCITLLSVIILLNTGCKKESTNADKEFGFAKLTVDCGGKCSVSYTVEEVVNNVDIDRAQGVYSIKYKRNYALKIDVTPIDIDQKVVVNVYSRETKQIYHNDATRKVNELWSAQILVP